MSATTTEQRTLESGTWTIDPVHSRIGFEVKHLGISTFRGRFGRYEGRIVTSSGDLTGVEGTIKLASTDVDDAKLAGHLGSEDFFAVDQHPEARFASTSVQSTGEGRYTVHGDLTMRGVARPVELDVTVEEGIGVGPLAIAGSEVLERELTIGRVDDRFTGDRLSDAGTGEEIARLLAELTGFAAARNRAGDAVAA